MATYPLAGSMLAMILFDVAEEIHLDQLGDAATRRAGQAFKRAAAEYIRFERPPVIEPVESVRLDSGEDVRAQIKYYDYGVISILFERSFQGNWPDVIALAGAWASSPEFERQAREIARAKIKEHGSALVKVYREWLMEDYFVVHPAHIPGSPDAATLVTTCGQSIAQIVRGETVPLSGAEQNEVLQSSLSYYPADLAVLGWHTAFLLDTAAGAQAAIQLLKYANSQLLEFRHYDELLTRELAGVYRSLDRGTGLAARFRLSRESTRFQTVVLEVTALAERADNAIKFVKDMFSARLHRLAAAKIGVLDYEGLVHQKLKTANELYRHMVDQFQHSRAFVLELMIVIILIIDLVFLFRGK